RDVARADALILEMGMVPDPRKYDFAHHRKMIEALYEPWLHDRPFKFNPDFVRKTWELMAARNPNKFRTNLPKDWVLTNRLQWGLYAILASLGAEANWRRMMLELLYDHP